ncbi:MAG TPA: ester cyclase, partial [Thermoleophilaceae bacterium]|nr:ester cyclase [Thermoleophilaceae bacterium]
MQLHLRARKSRTAHRTGEEKRCPKITRRSSGELIDEVWNGGRVEAIEELLRPEYARHDPALPQTAHGPSGLADNVRLYREAFPDLNIEIEELVSTDDTVTMRWRAGGTHRGELMG